MKSKQEIRDWLLKNCTDNEGDLDLSGLDFSDFDGNVLISYMKVKNDLFQGHQKAGGNISQYGNEAGKSIYS